jgi:hypothetical protein
MSDDSFAKFHDHESPAGRVLVGIRFFLGAVYVASIVMTIRTQQARGSSESLQAFLKRLLVFGSAWFLCFPVLVLCSGFFVHYQRHRVVAGGGAAHAVSVPGRAGTPVPGRDFRVLEALDSLGVGAAPRPGGRGQGCQGRHRLTEGENKSDRQYIYSHTDRLSVDR